MAGKPRILVVDDDRLMLTLLIGVLRQEGFHDLDKASSGAEALEKCLASPPDIVFLDIEMPGMNGIETLDALKKQGVQTQVVLVSATPRTQYVMEAKELNAAGFVVKPMSAKVVSDAIAKCLKLAHPGSVGVKV
ncbi:MAG: response regulator [Thiobacillus sp.]|nr:response regulator [Thiobacillus sp.]